MSTDYVEICSRCDCGIEKEEEVHYQFGSPVCLECSQYAEDLRIYAGMDGKQLHDMFYEVNPWMCY